MENLLLNRDFQMPADGWYQIAPLGEFSHAGAGVVQVIDQAACEEMANAFKREAVTGGNFIGLLIDFDHFSLSGETKSEAAGWIVDLENRGRKSDGSDASDGSDDGRGGLWAKIRWSDVGEEAVKGGRYRFLSPVWARSDCVDLGPSTSSANSGLAGSGQAMRRVRPVRLLNAAVTNDPNLKGMRPLSNRSQETGDRSQKAEGEEGSRGDAEGAEGDFTTKNAKSTKEDQKRFKWVLGDSPEGRHCPSCEAMAGQVHTMAKWDAAGIRPGSDALFCQGNCHCRLEETADAAGGEIKLPNRGSVSRGVAECAEESTRKSTKEEDGCLANIGWTDEARAASLAVRRAKAARRDVGKVPEADLLPDLPAESRAAFESAVINGAYSELEQSGQLDGMTDEQVRTHLRSSLSEAYRRQAERIARERGAAKGAEGSRADAERAQGGTTKNMKGTKEEVLANIGWTDEARAASLAVRRAKAAARRAGGGSSSSGDSGGSGQSDGGASDEEATRETDYEGMFEEDGLDGMSPDAVNKFTDQIRDKLRRGKDLSPTEEGFLAERTARGYAGRNDGDPIFKWQEQQPKIGNRKRMLSAECGTLYDGSEEEDMVGFLVNTGWKDEARIASLAVRRAKAGARTAAGPKTTSGPATREPPTAGPKTTQGPATRGPGEWVYRQPPGGNAGKPGQPPMKQLPVRGPWKDRQWMSPLKKRLKDK